MKVSSVFIAVLFMLNLITISLLSMGLQYDYSNLPLTAAIIGQRLNDAYKLLKDQVHRDHYINTLDSGDQSALNAAIFHDDPKKPIKDRELLKLAEEIIKYGGQIDREDGQGNTPLMIAIDKQNYEAAKMLIERGADINYINKKGETALSRLAEKWTGRRDYTEIANLFRKEGAKGPKGESFEDFAKTQDQNSNFAQFAKTSVPLTSEELLEALNQLSLNLQVFATLTNI